MESLLAMRLHQTLKTFGYTRWKNGHKNKQINTIVN